ncbi:MAG: hypothetical protein CM1200mP40_09580 [Gammaproteobacteria bacterium]|nr:MAG: hypothetical protein CM1200mP40_09580 [Gammaproteobacteria bacterium]
MVRARAVAKQLNVDLAIIDKRRPTANEAQIMHIIGDVNDRCCFIVDEWWILPARCVKQRMR